LKHTDIQFNSIHKDIYRCSDKFGLQTFQQMISWLLNTRVSWGHFTIEITYQCCQS